MLRKEKRKTCDDWQLGTGSPSPMCKTVRVKVFNKAVFDGPTELLYFYLEVVSD